MRPLPPMTTIFIFVASLLGELGAAVLDGDRAGHEVLEEPDVITAARERWGSAVFSPQGSIDRKALGRIVFADTPEARRELEYLEKLTHPRIGARLLAQVEAAARRGAPMAVLDAAVMPEVVAAHEDVRQPEDFCPLQPGDGTNPSPRARTGTWPTIW